MRIIFMGTPDFAVPCLRALIGAGHEVCAVFTQPDKPVGRRQELTPSPVKAVALSLGIPVYQPATLRTPEVQEDIKALKSDIIIVVAYGKILPKAVLETPVYGCVNVHGSLLPKYRGAAPIQWTVINGDKYAGVTTMHMAEGLDTGDMIYTEQVEVGADETSGGLYERLSVLGAALLVKTAEDLQNGRAPRTPQDNALASAAPMLSKELAQMDWKRPAEELHNLVRGLSPWPVACTHYNGKLLKVHRARARDGFAGLPGQAADVGGAFVVACGKNTALELLEVQYEGGKRMPGRDFLRGHSDLSKTIFL